MSGVIDALLGSISALKLAEAIEHRMLIAQDIKKEFNYDKSSGQWFWCDRAEARELDERQGPFHTFIEALFDAAYPYVEEQEQEQSHAQGQKHVPVQGAPITRPEDYQG